MYRYESRHKPSGICFMSTGIKAGEGVRSEGGVSSIVHEKRRRCGSDFFSVMNLEKYVSSCFIRAASSSLFFSA